MQPSRSPEFTNRIRIQGAFLLVITIFLMWYACIPQIGMTAPPAPPVKMDSGLALIQTPDGSTIYAEIADTPEKRSRGLMFRTSMAPDRGMLFTFSEPGMHTFWMKNTKMALDMLWLDQKGTIVHVAHDVPICERTDNLCPRYRSTTLAYFVLELTAGQADKLKLRKGTRLSIQLPD